MAKRFTDSDKWDNIWFASLPSKYKLFWFYILDRCDNAGFWTPNFSVAKAYVGEDFESEEVKRYFKDKIISIENGKWFVPKFLIFQYPNGLTEKSIPQKSVINKLIKNQAIPIVSKAFGNSYVTLCKGYKDKAKEKDKEKDMDKDKEKDENYSPENILLEDQLYFEQAYLMKYPTLRNDMNHILRQFDLSVRSNEEELTLRQLRLRFEKWLNSWRQNESKYGKGTKQFKSAHERKWGTSLKDTLKRDMELINEKFN